MNFIVTVKESARPNIHEIADQLRRIGRVDRILKITGIITGQTTLNLADLEKIDGVKKAEKNREISI